MAFFNYIFVIISNYTNAMEILLLRSIAHGKFGTTVWIGPWSLKRVRGFPIN